MKGKGGRESLRLRSGPSLQENVQRKSILLSDRFLLPSPDFGQEQNVQKTSRHPLNIHILNPECVRISSVPPDPSPQEL